MADRMNIKFTLQAVDRFSANMKKLEEKLDSVKRKADKVDANREIQVNADVDAALRNLNRLQAQVDDIDRSSRKVKKVKISTEDAQASLQRISRAVTGLDGTRVDIDADTRSAMTNLRRVDDFMSDIRRQNTQIRMSISAETRDYDAALRRIARQTDSVMNARDNYSIGINTMPASRALNELKRAADGATRPRELEIGADMSSAIAEMAALQAASEAILRVDAEVTADTSRAMRELMTFRALANLPIVIKVRTEMNQLRSAIGSIATISRNAGEAIMFQFTSVATMFSTALVPIIAVTVGNLANLAVMAGTAGGATFGLATAFAAAGLAAGGVATVAIPVLKDLFTHIEDAKKSKEQYNKAMREGNEKAAAKHLAEYNRVVNSMSKEQIGAMGALNKFKESFRQMTDAVEPGVLTAFTVGLAAVNNILTLARPMIEASVDAVRRLMESLNTNLETEDVQAFFEFLSNNGAASLEIITKSLGNFMQGLFNLFTAFGPLSVDMQGGFLAMSESFRAWAASLSESQGFQNFVNYIRENWPKVKEIFGDGIMGMIEMLSAFAPSASSFMDNLVNMMNRFREWAETLESNDSFQRFIDYLIVNGPRVTSFFGSFIDMIVSLGEAIAPIGAVMIQAATDFFNFFTTLNQNYPIIAQIGAAVITLAGFLGSLMIPVRLLMTTFSLLLPVLKGVWTVITFGFSLFMRFSAILQTVVGAVLRFLPVVGRIGLTLLRLAGPVGIVVSLIVGLAIAIYQNWGTIGPWISNLWSRVTTAISSAWTVIKTVVSAGLSFVVSWVLSKMAAVVAGFQSRLAAAKAIVSAAFSTIRSLVASAISAVVSRVVSGLARLVSSFTSGFNRARSIVTAVMGAIRSYIASALANIVARVASFIVTLVSRFTTGFARARAVVTTAFNLIRNIVTTVIAAIVSKVVSGLARMVSAFTNGMNRAKSIVSSAIEAIKGLFNIDLSAQGRKIVESVANGIKGAIGSVTGAISSVTEKIRNFLPFSPAKEGALRDLDKLNFGGTIAKSMSRQTGTVRRAMNDMMIAASPNVDFAVDNAYVGAGNAYASARASRAQESRTIVEVPVHLNGREIARASNDEQRRMNAREEARVRQFSRTGGA